MILSKADADLIWGLLPKWVREIPTKEHAYDPMYFGTLSREGDIRVHAQIRRILYHENPEQIIEQLNNKTND